MPVDGAMSQLGDIKHDSIFQAKGHDYSLTTLLGGKPELAAPFKNGKFSTVYLAPKDYHRIHMPMDGQLTDMVYVPGDLFSVNPLTARRVPGLFARNERVVAIFNTPKGKMAMVLVGATIVASIETVWAGTVSPPVGRNVVHWQYPSEGEDAVFLKKGDELGRFKLGSTIVACFEPDMVEFADYSAGDDTRLGDVFATLTQ
jgi:phosphatidylserine decarboxylase